MTHTGWGLSCHCAECRRERQASLNASSWRADQVAALRAVGKDAAAERLLVIGDGPHCWDCEIIKGLGSCRCPIAANE